MLPINERVGSSLKVVGKNVIHSNPGGTYDLNEANYIEERIVSLHMLQHFISMMIEDICECGENRVILADETEDLAGLLFRRYQKYIEAGVDVFSVKEYYKEVV